jgi:hypothetical protein
VSKNQKSKSPAAPDAGRADFSTTHSASAEQPDADNAAGSNETAAAGPGAGSASPGADSPQPQTRDVGAAQAGAAPDAPGGLPEAIEIRLADAAALLTARPDLCARALVVVKSKSDRRRRAGRAFSRAETAIPLSELSALDLAAIAADPELIASIRVPAPTQD